MRCVLKCEMFDQINKDIHKSKKFNQNTAMYQLLETLIYSVLIPLAVFMGLKMGGTALFNYIKTLWVEGKPNEWVLIMNNGKMKAAGVGLRCFKGPFDQVATFPAKVFKVNFDTE